MHRTLTVSPLKSIRTRVAAAMLTIFLVSLWSLSYYDSLVLRQDMEHQLGDQQLSTVSMLADDVNREVQVRLEALKAVALTISADTMGNAVAMETFLIQRPVLQGFFNGGVIIYRLDGTAIAEFPRSAGRVGINYMDIDTVAAALKQGQTTVGTPVIGKKLQTPVFGMTVPIRNPQGQLIGALSGVTNLGKPNFLDVISESQYGKTGGYVLLVPRLRLVVTATDKRRTMSVLPGEGVNPVMDKYLSGYEGSGVLVNPSGEEVLASGRPVPAAQWYVMAALPTAEAFFPIQFMQQRMLVATLTLTLLAGALSWWILKLQLAPMLATARKLTAMSQSQQVMQPLPIGRPDEIGQLVGGFNHLLHILAQRDEVLKESEGRLRAIMDNSSTVIFMKDLGGRYLYVNRQYESLFHISNARVQGKTDYDVFSPAMADAFVQADRRVVQMGSLMEVEEQVPHDDGMHTYMAIKFPLRNSAGDIYAVCGIATDITQRKQSEEALRIAAVAFESQEGIVVTDARLHFVRVNHAFTAITGYVLEDVWGQGVEVLGSDVHDSAFYDAVWDHAKRTGAWHGEMWIRRKNGSNLPARVTITGVRDAAGQVTQFVGNLTDATSSQLQEQQRLRNEAAHRDALVREVHHRIKNNLQGITGLLRQFAKTHPQTAEPINQVIGQMHGVSVIHGLQGRAGTSIVRLYELTSAIAEEIGNLWQAAVVCDVPPLGMHCTVAEKESVPIALVLNELILNAIKHGDRSQEGVHIAWGHGTQAGGVQIKISNVGQFATVPVPFGVTHTGLKLISALMPRQGARLVTEQHGARVVVVLELAPPVISLEPQESL